MTYQETGKYIYDWFYREYDDIASLASMSLDAAETAASLASYRVFLSEFLDRLDRGEDVEKLKKDMFAYARAIGIRR